MSSTRPEAESEAVAAPMPPPPVRGRWPRSTDVAAARSGEGRRRPHHILFENPLKHLTDFNHGTAPPHSSAPAPDSRTSMLFHVAGYVSDSAGAGGQQQLKKVEVGFLCSPSTSC